MKNSIALTRRKKCTRFCLSGGMGVEERKRKRDVNEERLSKDLEVEVKHVKVP